MKHTPGPWTAILNSSWGERHKEQFGDRSGFVICHKERGELTCLASIIGMPFRTQEEINANAKLIAAAPELLEALKLATLHIPLSSNYDSVHETINKAIEKATL